jgi:hypothetical protein
MADLPALSQLRSGAVLQPSPSAMPPPTHVGERGGPWDSVALNSAFHPALQTALPMTIVYIRDAALGWLPYLLVAESALLRRAGASRGLGVYALKRLRGPSESGANNGDVIGHYGGAVLASAPSRQEANQQAQTFVRQGRQFLFTMRVQGHTGWHVVDGEQQSVLPLLHRVNDPRDTPLAPRCNVSEYGLFRAVRDIPPLDWTRPLSEQAVSELSFAYGDEYWQTHDMLGTADLPLDVGLNAVDALFAKLGLSNIGCRESKRPRRSQPAEAAPPAPNLSAVEVDATGTVVYADLQPREGEDSSLQALRARLLTVRPTTRTLERLPLINRSRVLVEVEDRMALDLFQAWLLTTTTDSLMGEGLRRLLQPLGNRILLLGAHFICPRVTEYEPRILPQQPHTDVGTRGEVIAVGLHLQGAPMDTLLDPHATLTTSGEVQDGSGFRRAHTTVFAFETAAVHAGPGVPHVEGPYPRFLTSRIFFLLASADLDPVKVAEHRADNGLAGAANLAFQLPTPPS